MIIYWYLSARLIFLTEFSTGEKLFKANFSRSSENKNKPAKKHKIIQRESGKNKRKLKKTH